ncbi:DUF4306 domain-containing protein [Halobacillus trueperi]|uniref:DUF4306 domain-containing protein n=1 Tax=Halobacillus trueperi TaxID=156205 RepID=A0A3E0JE18_9BACI|nr:DUF4306 domain-containing protein [Halobacillus trueperi]REJ11186.1 DUF4306 domain-containing protein [Halobacillus trueperi]
MRVLVQYVAALCTFLFSTVAALYEGSEIKDHPFEWRSSAVFSQWVHGEVKTSSDILVVDYLVYAAKFKPFFPLLLLLGLLYFIALSGVVLFHKRKFSLIMYFGVWAVMLLLAAFFTFPAHSLGMKMMSIVFITSGTASGLAASLLYLIYKKEGVVVWGH